MSTRAVRQGVEAQAGEGVQLAAPGAWEGVRADPEIQFAPVAMPETPPPPDWLTGLLAFLGELFAPLAGFLASNWGAIWPVLAAIAGLVLLYALVRLIAPDFMRLRRRRNGAPGEEDWRPAEAVALALLEEADRLASEGCYDEAVHLLLTRSVGQIAALRPELVEPSSTAREIAALPALPEAAARAFAAIAQRVERSLFALARLSAEDWTAARAAYADFALAAERRLAA